MPMAADAAGLGKLTLLSALGQPLQAEIEISASREELSGLSARLASAEAFKQQGIEFVPALTGIRFALEKRQNGMSFLRVSSERPLNEPFVDMLVELNWSSGRLRREYTFLLDPADVFQKPAPTPVVAPEVRKEAAPTPAAMPAPAAAAPEPKPIIEMKAPEPRVAEKPVEERPLKRTEEIKPPPRAAAAAPVEKVAEKPAEKPVGTAEVAASRLVKKGDTLAKIAGEIMPEGVNLDQMLLALFRSNKEAFDGENMNRLRAGKILAIPDREAVVGIDQGEAKKAVVAQASDFNAYRKKLALAVAAEPAKQEAPKQVASGKITPRVEDKAPAAPAGKDKLEVSRAEAAKDGAIDGKKVAGRISALE
jgi:pilus assembly protein FimV